MLTKIERCSEWTGEGIETMRINSCISTGGTIGAILGSYRGSIGEEESWAMFFCFFVTFLWYFYGFYNLSLA